MAETIMTSSHATRRRHVPFLRMMQHCIMAPGFQPKERPVKAGVMGTGSVIGLPFMPSCLCNVRRKATEDLLTAPKCRLVDNDVTIPGSPSPWTVEVARAVQVASQHQNFTLSSPRAALSANIDCLVADLCLVVRVGVVPTECLVRSDDDVFRHHR